MDSSQDTPTPKSKPLTPRQRQFVDAYVGKARFNATQAAIQAGYSPKTAGQKGHELKNIEAIRARIDEVLEAHTITSTEVLRELTDVGMRGLHEFIEITRYDKDGNPIAAKMDASAKMKALELLGKSQRLFSDRVEHTGADGGPISITTVEVVTDEATS